jgi:hypothetical protein
MAQYIDKSALVAEIDRRLHQLTDAAFDSMIGRNLIEIKDFINTLEVKEVDLDNFIKEEFDKYSCVDGYGQLSVSYNMAEFYSMIKRLTKAQKGE